MAQQTVTTSCAYCEREGLQDAFLWLSHADFCEPCIHKFEGEGWVRKIPNEARSYQLTESGAQAMPGLKAIAFCPVDGMLIYQRWADAGIAQAGDNPACPYCVDR